MNKMEKKETPLPRPICKKRLAFYRGIILAAGLLGIVVGVCFDGVQAVIANAIALCMSCIGLG